MPARRAGKACPDGMRSSENSSVRSSRHHWVKTDLKEGRNHVERYFSEVALGWLIRRGGRHRRLERGHEREALHEALLFLMGMAPVAVMVFIGIGGPSPTVAEILHSVDAQDGRS